MVKYVDSGEGPDSGSKRKKRMGFKVDRRANYEKIMRKKMGKDTKKTLSSSPSAPKAVVFNEASLKEYVTSLHKNKNERRVKAFVDMKRKIKKDNSKVRREQREEARRAYNKYAKVPILPNYTFHLPKASLDDEEAEEGKEGYSEEEQDSVQKESLDPLDAVVQPLLEKRSALKRSGLHGSTVHAMPLSMTIAAPNAREEEKSHPVNAEKNGKKNKRRHEKMSTESVEDEEAENGVEAALSTSSSPPKRINTLEDFYADSEKASPQAVMVEVRPLFETLRSPQEQSTDASNNKNQRHRTDKGKSSALPSVNFSDLPAVVEEELRRLRKETKGPSRTKPRIATLKELEKIRKIRKHSRKGHGKKTASGKRKNRS